MELASTALGGARRSSSAKTPASPRDPRARSPGHGRHRRAPPRASSPARMRASRRSGGWRRRAGRSPRDRRAAAAMKSSAALRRVRVLVPQRDLVPARAKADRPGAADEAGADDGDARHVANSPYSASTLPPTPSDWPETLRPHPRAEKRPWWRRRAGVTIRRSETLSR